MTNPIVHCEFAGPDDQNLQAFYGEVFGWEIKTMGPGYALVKTPDGSPDGAILEAQTAHVVLGIEVDDLEGAVDKAVSLGASVVMPPTDNGYVNKAQVSDPAGNVISLIESAKTDP